MMAGTAEGGRRRESKTTGQEARRQQDKTQQSSWPLECKRREGLIWGSESLVAKGEKNTGK